MKAKASFVVGLGLVAVMWLVGIAWPLTEGYPSLFHWLKDRAITEDEPRFDRTQLRADLVTAGFTLGDPAHVRIYKRERRLELWMQKDDGAFEMFRDYAICNFSGDLGPKVREGDRQAPEGFYRIARAQLNPNSRHHLAFNLGFPNQFDRQLDRTGSALMVHGGCTSIGCYAITDAAVDEVYAVIEAALNNGQDEVDVAAFPFALSEGALVAHAGGVWDGFWRNLKQGFDLFEQERKPPKVAACNGVYRFGADAESEGCVAITGWV
ncbi:MAG: 2-dehydro-3-deoxyphosphooctonate aldolase [Devosia sp.]